jgi:hypothetical protein
MDTAKAICVKVDDIKDFIEQTLGGNWCLKKYLLYVFG